jgi:hypothetical protein
VVRWRWKSCRYGSTWRGVEVAVNADFEQEREEYIQRSSQERDFFDYYIGRPHPASIGAVPRRLRRRGVRANGSRVAAWMVLAVFVIGLLTSAVEALAH